MLCTGISSRSSPSVTINNQAGSEDVVSPTPAVGSGAGGGPPCLGPTATLPSRPQSQMMLSLRMGMRSSRSRSHSLVRLPEVEGLGNVDGVEVVLLVSGASDVSLGDSLGKRPSNETVER